MNDPKNIITFPKLTGLPPLDLAVLNPVIAGHVLRLWDELYQRVDFTILDSTDLTSDETERFRGYVKDFAIWLCKCGKDVQGFALAPQIMFANSGDRAMLNLQRLLEGVCERKLEKAQQAIEDKKSRAAEAEGKRRLSEALEILGLNTSMKVAAEAFLAQHELSLFNESIQPAVDAVCSIQQRGGNLDKARYTDTRLCEYWMWRAQISRRQKAREQAEQDARQAERGARTAEEAARVASALNVKLWTEAIHELKAELSNNVKLVIPCPVIVSRYRPEEWCELDLPDEEQIRDRVDAKIRKQLPNVLSDSVDWDLTWETLVFPEATYEDIEGFPVLNWNFTAELSITANLVLGKGQVYKQPGRLEKIEGKGMPLGSIYFIEAWGADGDFGTPVSLLRTLAEGLLEAPGVKVSKRGASLTLFDVDEVGSFEVHDSFQTFIMEMSEKEPLWVSLLEVGIIDTVTAELLQEKWGTCFPEPVSPSGTGEPDLDEVVDRLMEMGWTEEKAKQAVDALEVTPGTTVEAMMKLILGQN